MAGLAPGSNLRFIKQQLAAQYVLPVSSLLSLSLSVGSGLLLPWGAGGAGKPTCIVDRFFIGGVSSLRGFKVHGVGPTDLRRPKRIETLPGDSPAPPARPKRDALGGDLLTSVLAAANFAIPHPLCEALGIHAQAFVNGGNIVQLAGQRTQWLGQCTRWLC